jgi:hypothetical protein
MFTKWLKQTEHLLTLLGIKMAKFEAATVRQQLDFYSNPSWHDAIVDVVAEPPITVNESLLKRIAGLSFGAQFRPGYHSIVVTEQGLMNQTQHLTVEARGLRYDEASHVLTRAVSILGSYADALEAGDPVMIASVLSPESNLS